MNRARPIQTLLAAIATMVAAWPVTTLFEGRAWVGGTLGLVALAALLGMAGRALDLPPMLTLSAQMIGVTTIAVVTHLHDHLDTSLPSALRALGADAHHTVTAYAAPAPTSVGILFFTALIIAIIAITVDFLAVTGRSPGLAGVPLLVEFIISAANSGGSLHPKYSFALGLAWLAMLYAASERSAQDWSGLRARTSGRSNPTSALGGHDFGPFSRVAGVGALVAALVIAGSLPAASQKFVANGLARGQGTSADVGFSTDLDLHQNLTDRDKSPVLTFRSPDLNPPPLRALVADNYASDHWVPSRPTYVLRGVNGVALRRWGSNTAPTSATPYSMTVTSNSMRPPFVVAPTQVDTADFGDTTWSYDPENGQPSTSRLKQDYTVRYLTEPATARPTSQTIDKASFGADLEVDPSSAARIAALVRTAAPSDTGSSFQRVIAIQNYFRDGGGFTYSLTLAPTRKDPSQRPLDPISNFLVTKQGYCMQFATAMVMAARSIGVPARLGVGFLPGTVGASGAYQVLQSDAHAWPELYFPGMGWTRFEPTPGSRTGLAPAYASPVIGSPESSAPRRSTSAPRSTRPSDSSTGAATTTAPTTSTGSGLQLGWLWWVLGVLLLLAAALTVLPLLARWSRRTLRTGGGGGDAERVQAQWDDLVARMEDLGIDPAPEVSPRSQEEYYRARLVVGREGRESLHRAVDVLERVRYTDRPGADDDLTVPAEDLLMRIRRGRSFRTRLTASLFPRSGRRAVRSLVGRVRRD